jgi:acyl carrier protein
MDHIKAVVKQYILNEFLPGEDSGYLTDSVHLIRDQILNSLATLQLVAFLEKQFGIRLEAHEANPDNLDTLADIATLVEQKLQEKS